MGFIFGIVNLKGGSVKSEDVWTLGKAVQWDDFESRIEINRSYGWGYCWNKKRTPKAGIYTSERVAVLCDARIYNSDELKQAFEFEQPEEAFAKAYLKWGDSFADKFNGDFAAVIIDFQQQKVLLVRDHIGVRPLTYSIKDDLLIFASHEFGIAKSNLIDNTLSKIALIQSFFPFKKQRYYLTVFSNIKKIVQGTVLIASASGINKMIYWHPDKIKTETSLAFENAVSNLRQHLIRSVQTRMTSGMIGTHLSGGLDSSGVAAILSDLIDKKERLKGYSWTPEKDLEVNERNEKEFIVDFVKDKNICVDFMSYDDPANIDDFILPEFEQMPNEIYTLRQAHQDDISSMFSGWGGDEFVSLGSRGVVNYLISRVKLLALFRWVKQKGVRTTLSSIRSEVLTLFNFLGLMDFSQMNRNGFAFFKTSFVVRYFRYFFFNREKHIYGLGGRRGLMLWFLYRNHLAQRMDSWTLFGEKYGIEYKYPLLDKQLIEFWFKVPVRITYAGATSRFLYREALKGTLTESIRNRPDKFDTLFFKYFDYQNTLRRDVLIKMPELFNSAHDLKCFKIFMFDRRLKDTSGGRIKSLDMYNVRLFLRYKSLVEKYVATNPYCMKKQKNNDSENL